MKILSEKGVSAIEFALVLPILMTLTFGIIEFGVLLFDKAVITNASREGARFGIVYATDGVDPIQMSDDEIRTIVKDYANNILINLGPAGQQALEDSDIVIVPETRETGDDLEVRVTYTYDFLVFPNITQLVGGSFDGTMDLVGRTIMRME